ncbi:MAG: amidohydrolase [Bacteroidota bacterium]
MDLWLTFFTLWVGLSEHTLVLSHRIKGELVRTPILMSLKRKSFMYAITYLLISFLAACENEQPLPMTNAENETVFYNGEIYTVNDQQAWVSAIYIRNGIIKAVGQDEAVINAASDNAELINLRGAFMMPGIHDVHVHPLEAASENVQFTLDDRIQDAEVYTRDIENASLDNPGSGWLLGWGHWIDVLLDAKRMPKEIIDEVVSNRPVVIMEQTSHSVWCNSRALALMGVDSNTPDPPGGIIMREENGEANGLLIDNAGNLLLDIALSPNADRTENDYWGLVEFALPELARNGITSICDARTYWKRDHHTTWQRVADEGLLTARVNLGLWAYPDGEDAQQLAILKSLYTNSENSLLKINQIKLYADGIIHNTTSAMHETYRVNYFGFPINKGLNYFTQERVATYIRELENVGFDFHIHAIGNRGVHESLNAIELSATQRGRHRLTHVEYVDPVDVARFAQLNVTADAQVAGDFSQPARWHDNDYLIGSALNDNVIPIKSLANAGARLTLSSDWDVSELNPFIGMSNAVGRSPQEVSLEEAIKAYTINPAYVMRQEEKVGTIEVGKEADLIILDRNLFDISASQIRNTQVNATYLRGELVYQR